MVTLTITLLIKFSCQPGYNFTEKIHSSVATIENDLNVLEVCLILFGSPLGDASNNIRACAVQYNYTVMHIIQSAVTRWEGI